LRLRKKAARYKDAKTFADYREMLDTMADQIDAVTVSTPDHSHAPASVMAMKKGKHVYCQKPLTWSLYEARRMRELAAETGVVTQMGNQGTSEDGLREAAEVIRAGAIGEVKAVHVWTNRPIWDQGIARPEGSKPIPEGLHWDLFLGPAPERPYNDGYHPFAWRGWTDFGTGALGDMACHTANMAVMALDLFDPIAFEAVINSGLGPGGETYPKNSQIKFEFAERGDFPACVMYWYDGGNLPSTEILPNDVLPDDFLARVENDGRAKAMSSGSLVVGSEGMVFSPNDYGARYYLLPEKKFLGYKKPEQTLPRVTAQGNVDQRHMSEFINACKGEGKTMSNFGYAGRLTETILAGNLSLRVNQRIEWDAVNLRATNCDEANKYVSREYRKGWTL
jgi:predicted dehydrogenase